MSRRDHVRDLRPERGYAMAGLLVAIGIMSILMSVAMPAWRTLAKREKEAELLFRGQQYMRAIDLYQRRFPGAYPTDIEMLVEGRFLRRLYPDPMTGEPFRILTQGSAAAAAGETTAETDEAGGRPSLSGSRRAAGNLSSAARSGVVSGRAGRVSPGPFSGTPGGDEDEEMGGIVGVVSRSTEESLRDYNGATRYDQWLFVHQGQAVPPGAAGTAAPFPGGMGSGPGGPAGIGGAAGSLEGGPFRRPAGGLRDRAGPGR